jgi:hypothetical protein
MAKKIFIQNLPAPASNSYTSTQEQNQPRYHNQAPIPTEGCHISTKESYLGESITSPIGAITRRILRGMWFIPAILVQQERWILLSRRHADMRAWRLCEWVGLMRI